MSNSPARPNAQDSKVKSPKHSGFLIKVLLIGLVIIAISGLIGYLLKGHYSSIQNFTQIWQQYAAWFLLWRVLLIAAIVYAWPYYIGYLLKKSQSAKAPTKKGSMVAASSACRMDSRVLVEREAFLSSPENRIQERQSRQWLKSRYLILEVV